MIRIRKILYATDFSPYSNQAYFHAVALAESHGASLTILFVYPGGFGAPETAGEGEDRSYWLEQLQQIRPVNENIRTDHILLEGDPASEIVNFARESSSDLIVMGTHGRSGLERLLMGSVAEKVMREAPCSVLVVKLPKGVPVTEPHRVAIAAGPV
jgi:nucleotide-binding universal stress UspA family protein